VQASSRLNEDEREVARCKRHLLVRGKVLSSDCSLWSPPPRGEDDMMMDEGEEEEGGTEEEEYRRRDEETEELMFRDVSVVPEEEA
jgi:hypothetical protein